MEYVRGFVRLCASLSLFLHSRWQGFENVKATIAPRRQRCCADAENVAGLDHLNSPDF
jgi:hypothetical protein